MCIALKIYYAHAWSLERQSYNSMLSLNFVSAADTDNK